MITLGLDTSEALVGVALWEEALLGESIMEGHLHHAEELLPLIDGLLDKCILSKDQVQLVSVNRGPGSFTGLRIGLATAMGICQSLGIQLVGVDGMVAYRARLDVKEHVCVLVPDRRDLLYVRWFAGMRAISEVEVVPTARLLARISRERKELSVVGSGAELLRERLERVASVKLAPEAMNHPSPAWIARLGKDSYSCDQLYDLEPTYVEPAIFKTIS